MLSISYTVETHMNFLKKAQIDSAMSEQRPSLTA